MVVLTKVARESDDGCDAVGVEISWRNCATVTVEAEILRADVEDLNVKFPKSMVFSVLETVVSGIHDLSLEGDKSFSNKYAAKAPPVSPTL